MKITPSKIGIVVVCSVLFGLGVSYQNCGQINQDSDQDPNSKTFTTSELSGKSDSKNTTRSYVTPTSELSFAELVSKAGIIVEGEVLSLNSAYSEHKNIVYTFANIAVKTVIKGEIKEPTIELRYAGGQVGDHVLKVTAMPTFKKGEKVVLLLKSDIDPFKTLSPIMGLESGHFIIGQDSKTKSEGMLLSSGAKIIGYDATTGQLDTARYAPPRKNMPKPLDPSQDVLVEENDSKKLAQRALTRDEFVKLIGELAKDGPPGTTYRSMAKEDRLKALRIKAVPAPKVEMTEEQAMQELFKGAK